MGLRPCGAAVPPLDRANRGRERAFSILSVEISFLMCVENCVTRVFLKNRFFRSKCRGREKFMHESLAVLAAYVKTSPPKPGPRCSRPLFFTHKRCAQLREKGNGWQGLAIKITGKSPKIAEQKAIVAFPGRWVAISMRRRRNKNSRLHKKRPHPTKQGQKTHPKHTKTPQTGPGASWRKEGKGAPRLGRNVAALWRTPTFDQAQKGWPAPTARHPAAPPRGPGPRGRLLGC